MKQISVLVVLLSCLTSFAAGKPAQCNLTGQWKNDLGSVMNIPTMESNGQFTGAYLTTVTAGNNTIVESPLIGYKQLNNASTFGFVINWAFTRSITVFTGQCFLNATGQPVLRTIWLLRSESESINDDWKQTSIGSNIFHKLPTRSSSLKAQWP